MGHFITEHKLTKNVTKMNENKVEYGSPDETYFCEKVCEMEWSWFYEQTKRILTNTLRVIRNPITLRLISL